MSHYNPTEWKLPELWAQLLSIELKAVWRWRILFQVSTSACWTRGDDGCHSVRPLLPWSPPACGLPYAAAAQKRHLDRYIGSPCKSICTVSWAPSSILPSPLQADSAGASGLYAHDARSQSSCSVACVVWSSWMLIVWGDQSLQQLSHEGMMSCGNVARSPSCICRDQNCAHSCICWSPCAGAHASPTPGWAAASCGFGSLPYCYLGIGLPGDASSPALHTWDLCVSSTVLPCANNTLGSASGKTKWQPEPACLLHQLDAWLTACWFSPDLGDAHGVSGVLWHAACAAGSLPSACADSASQLPAAVSGRHCQSCSSESCPGHHCGQYCCPAAHGRAGANHCPALAGAQQASDSAQCASKALLTQLMWQGGQRPCRLWSSLYPFHKLLIQGIGCLLLFAPNDLNFNARFLQRLYACASHKGVWVPHTYDNLQSHESVRILSCHIASSALDCKSLSVSWPSLCRRGMDSLGKPGLQQGPCCRVGSCHSGCRALEWHTLLHLWLPAQQPAAHTPPHEACQPQGGTLPQ